MKKPKKPSKLIRPKLISVNTLKNNLWKITSKLVRLQSNKCYTCDTYLEFSKRQAGHFWTKGGHQAARFALDNVRVQCDQCNRWKSGNTAEYAVRLRREIGDERFEALYRLAKSVKTSWKRDELEPLIEERKMLLTQLQNETKTV